MKKTIYALVFLTVLLSYTKLYAIEWNHYDSPDIVGFDLLYIDQDGNQYMAENGIVYKNIANKEIDYINKFNFDNIYRDNNFTDGIGINQIFKASNGNLIIGTTDINNPILYLPEGDSVWKKSNCKVRSSSDSYKNEQVFEYDNRIYYWGSELLVSNDYGETWETVKLSDSPHQMRYLFSYDAENANLLFYYWNPTTSLSNILIYNLQTRKSIEKELPENTLDYDFYSGFISGDSLYIVSLQSTGFYKCSLWKSTNLGDTWTTKEIDEYDLGIGVKEIRWTGFLADGTFAVSEVGVYGSYMEFKMYFSYDFGETWNRAGINDDSRIERSFLHNADLYFKSGVWYVKKNGNTDFEVADATFPGMGRYIKLPNSEIYYGFLKVFTRESDSEDWQFEGLSPNVYYGYDGSKYEVINNELVCTNLEGESTVLCEAAGIRRAPYNNSHGVDVIRCVPTEHQKDHIVAAKDGKLLYDKREDYVSYYTRVYFEDENTYFTYFRKKAGTHYQVNFVKSKVNSEEKDTIVCPDCKDVTHYAWQGNKAIVKNFEEFYISTSNGDSWNRLFADDKAFERNMYNIDIFNNKFYMYGPLGVLESEDGETWLNITDGLTTANVYHFEVDYAGRYHINTYEGHFISKTPISVEEQNSNFENAPEFSIFPNPSSDFISFSYENKFDSAEIFDLYGKKYTSNIDNKQIDVSNLPSGTYFLKVKSEGNAYLKQFVVAR